MPKRRRAERVLDKLLRGLAVGQWSPGETLPPTRELERQFRSSHATMLDALHLAAQRDLLLIRPRQPIEVLPAAADKAGALLAEQVARSGLRRLAILYPETMGPVKQAAFFRELIAAVEQRARAAGFQADVVTWPLLEQVNFARRLPDLGYGAAFAAAVRVEYLTSLYTMRQQHFPVVLMNATLPELPMPAVAMDEYGAARRMATLLANLGHRNICMLALAFDGRLKQRQHRTYGWFDYLAESGLGDSCAMPICYLTSEDETVKTVERILALPDPPTALVFAYGVLCQRFLKGFDAARVSVPQRLSVATFDFLASFTEASWCPPVTSISISLDRLAECALEMIGKLLAGRRQPRAIRLPMQLNLTDSIASPPAA